jgi:RNA polymerase sigma factor (sigma-70 family)
MSDREAPRTPGEVAESVLFDANRRSKLVGYAGSRFGIQEADAEDLLQDTALALLRQRGAVRNPDGYVFAAFRASCARFARARRGRAEHFAEGPADEAAGAAPSADPDRRLALQEALHGISSSCRRLLSAYYVEGLTLTEAAHGFTLAYAVVSRRISRCLQRLRACLN